MKFETSASGEDGGNPFECFTGNLNYKIINKSLTLDCFCVIIFLRYLKYKNVLLIF